MFNYLPKLRRTTTTITTKDDRKSVVDIYYESKEGNKFIVEMQKNIQTYIKDRALFYASYPIINQAQKGDDWDHRLSASQFSFFQFFTPKVVQ